MKPLHWSALRHIRQTPAHYKYNLEHPKPPTPPMRFGSLVGAFVMGKPRSFVVYEGARRGNAWKKFKEAHADLEIVTQDEWDRAMAAADEVRADRVAAELLAGAEREVKFDWSVDGRPCRGTPDLCRGPNDILADLKVTDSNPYKLRYQVTKMGWHAQLAWYHNGVDFEPLMTALIAVPPKPPHIVTVVEFTEKDLELGHGAWRSAFERLKVCEEAGQFPGYVQSAIPLDLQDDVTLTIDGEEVEL